MIQWDDYLVARQSGVKKLWKPLLENKISYLESLQGEQLKLEIHNLCVEYFDHGCTTIPIQHPKILSKVLNLWADEIALENEQYLLWAYKAIGFKGIEDIIGLEKPEHLLDTILQSNPDHDEAKALMFLSQIDALDFALHELPHGLLLNESVCLAAIARCESLIAEKPELADCKTRFGGDFNHYKRLYFSWIEYKNAGIQEDFFQWIS
ncbi:hypothetical protein BFW38_10085 [Terasakiispira papahanaumokuakeensis]|uniref:Uncharacterized protein n=1 Tax=Terasakiispira papahanaumokuakeensis TaxID=197479 RepID=A0A1E2VA26_9GAMM|nr:hypothetical protein [Terasakiispira papahanaumokuakeensis]ODC03841.1 hypothetical protein BFW38_10085 [Terasakiispira papahanaumokuakeensis]